MNITLWILAGASWGAWVSIVWVAQWLLWRADSQRKLPLVGPTMAVAGPGMVFVLYRGDAAAKSTPIDRLEATR